MSPLATPCPRTWIGSAATTSARIRSSKAKCCASTTTSSSSTSATRAKASSPATSGKKATRFPKIGETIRVLVEDVEDVAGRQDDRGMIVLSKRKAEKIEKWMKVMETVHEGDVVTGTVTRKIKGGLLVDIGVNVFLPASQVDIRRPPDIGDYIGQDDRVHDPQDRRGPAQHRRQPPQADRDRSGPRRSPSCSSELEVGQLRKGVVKNIADFGAFVDLGGIDGLLHITDMSWGRINHPQRDGQDRRGARGDGPAHRLREGKDRPRPEAEVGQPVGERRRRSTRSAPASRARSSTS